MGCVLSLIFFSFMGLAPSLTSEIEEAPTEERLLKFSLNQNCYWILKVVGQVMYIVLRIRCYMIPFLATQATASIIIGESFLVKNIILNILSIVFVTETDNLLLSFLISPSQIDEV